MKRCAMTICALLPLVVGVFHWRVTMEQRAKSEIQMLRMQDIYRRAKQGKSEGVPAYPAAIATGHGSRPVDRIMPESAVARGFLLESLSLSEDIRRVATIHNTVGFRPWAQVERMDTNRPSWPSEGTWIVTGTVIYPDQRNRNKDVVIGWETEMRCDEDRKNWKMTRLTTRPFSEDLPPRLLATAVGQRIPSIP